MRSETTEIAHSGSDGESRELHRPNENHRVRETKPWGRPWPGITGSFCCLYFRRFLAQRSASASNRFSGSTKPGKNGVSVTCGLPRYAAPASFSPVKRYTVKLPSKSVDDPVFVAVFGEMGVPGSSTDFDGA